MRKILNNLTTFFMKKVFSPEGILRPSNLIAFGAILTILFYILSLINFYLTH